MQCNKHERVVVMKKKFLIPAIIVLLVLLIVGALWSHYNKVGEHIEELILDKTSFVDRDMFNSPIFDFVLDKQLTKLVENSQDPQFIFTLKEEELQDWFDLSISPLNYFNNIFKILEKSSYRLDEKTEEIINKHFMDVVVYEAARNVKDTFHDVDRIHTTTQRNLAMHYLEGEAVAELTKLKKQYIQDNDATLFYNEFMPLMIFYEEAFSSINYGDYLNAKELKEFFKNSATETICTDGLGGYYDNRKEEYLAEDYGKDLLANNLFAEVHQEREKTYLFYGDFMVKLIHTRVSVSNTEFYKWLAGTLSDDKEVFVSNIQAMLYYKGNIMSQNHTPVSYGNNTKSVFLIGDIPIAVGDTYLVYGDEIIHLQ